MATIEEKEHARVEVLLVCYEISGGNRFEYVTIEDVVERTGLPQDVVEDADQWLADRDLVSHPVMAPVMSITARGVDDAERILRERLQPSGAPTAVLEVVTPSQKGLLERLAREIEELIDGGTLDLEPDDEAEARVQVDTIVTQLRSPRPRAGVVGTALKALAWLGGGILLGVLGNAAYDGLQALMHLG